MKYKSWIKGLSTVFVSFGSLLICVNLVLKDSPDYKFKVDEFFNETAKTGGSQESFMYKSEFETTTDMYTERVNLVRQIAEEGVVLLKNQNNALPLKKNVTDEPKVTLLGTSAFPYDKAGNIRNGAAYEGWGGHNFLLYGGCTGSPVNDKVVVTNEGTLRSPFALPDCLEKANVKVNPSCINVYSGKNYINRVDGSVGSSEAGGAFAVNEPYVQASDFSDINIYKDAAIVMVARSSSEGADYFPGERGLADKSDGAPSALGLSANERNLITQAAEISDKVIVLINSSVAMEINELKYGPLADKVDAVCWIGMTGSYGMDGVVRVLTGEASPSGSLPDIYASDASSSPAAQNFGNFSQDGKQFTWTADTRSFYTHSDNSCYTVMAEGIYDGYYYYETRYADTVLDRGNAKAAVGLSRYETDLSWNYLNEVTYSFGYGLSYTTFNTEFVPVEGKNYVYDEETKSLDFKVKVTNTGEVSGKHTVQMYASQPYTQYDIDSNLQKSAVQLVGFEKTQKLAPGESETLTINVPLKYVATYDEGAIHDGVTGGYIIENGDYYFSTGNGAHEALNNALVAQDASLPVVNDNGATANAELAVKFNTAFLGGFDEFGVNTSLFAKTENGTLVKNQVQEVNYNYYVSDFITYLSRNDYASTYPVAYAGEKALAVTSEMAPLLGTADNNAGRAYKFNTGTVDVTWGVNYELEEDDSGEPLKNEVLASLKGYDFDDPAWDKILTQISLVNAKTFAPYGGSFCIALPEIGSPMVYQADGPNGNVTSELFKRAPQSGYLAVSAGDPNRSYMSADMPCEPLIAATMNKELVEREGEMFGEDSLWSRNSIFWAPGMNLHRSPFNSRNHEYYSEDPILTNIMGVSMVRGGLRKGLIMSVKHFALNTQETFREGLSQFATEQSLRERELRAFQGVFEDVDYIDQNGHELNALGLMTSFSRFGVTGANAHRGVMVEILRKEWGFKGLSSTDFVNTGRYFNPEDCVSNNVTFMATSNGVSTLASDWGEYNSKFASDPVLNRAARDNLHYYLYAVANSSALNGIDVNTVVIDPTKVTSRWQVLCDTIGGSAVALSIVVFGVYVFVSVKFNGKKVKEESK